MKKLYLLLAFLFVSLAGVAAAQAQDVVYLKDGSIIHGSITEEVPGVSIKIATADGNVFVYKVQQIAKITHGDTAAQPAPADVPEGGPDETVVVVKHRHPRASVNDWKSDPNASFNIGAIYIGVGLMDPSVLDQFNTYLNYYYGNSYEFTPLTYSGDIGLGWYTNHLALKFTGTYAFNWEQQDYYYNNYSYYSLDEYLGLIGGELEVDLSLDDVQTSVTQPNARRVASVYLPLVVGGWQSSLTTYDNYGNSDVFTGTAVDFGTGLGARFIDDHHNLFDVQFLYRWSNANNMKDGYGYNAVLPSGKDLNASVEGFSFNVNYGYTF